MSSEYLNNKVFENIITTFQRSKRNTAKYELMIQDFQESERNDETMDEFRRAYDSSHKEMMESQQRLALAFHTLSENIVRYAKFSLIDSDDAIQEGVMICFEKIDRFDSRRGKAFNYFTTCTLNHLRQLYRTARNYNELKRKFQEFMQSKFESDIRRPHKIAKPKNEKAEK